MGGQKIYDATTTVSSSDLDVTGEVTGESISITGTGSVTDKNVGSGKTIDISGLSLSDGSHSASNYTIGTTSFAITRRNLSISGEKVYDGTGTVLAAKLIQLTRPAVKHLQLAERKCFATIGWNK